MSKELQHTMFGMREHHDVTSLLSLSLLDVSDPLLAFSFGLSATLQATGRLPLQRIPGRCEAMRRCIPLRGIGRWTTRVGLIFRRALRITFFHQFFRLVE